MDNTKSSETSDLNVLIAKYSPFFNEIKKRLFFTAAVFLASTILGFVFYERMIRFLIEILSLKGINIVFTSPFQFISLAISCGIATGLVIVFPLLLYQIMSFLKPALREKEYRMVIRSIPVSIILFLTGFTFGFLIMKWQIQIFLTNSLSLGIGNVLDISRLLNTVILTSTLLGVGFQFPIVLLLLLRIGIVKPEQLSKRRLWVYLGSFFFAVLLPADSILADILLALPLIVMFELTLILNSFFDRKKE